LANFLVDLPDGLARFLPRPCATGLQRLGSPGLGSPVLLTGSYALTVRRLKRALRGRDAWLVVADSRGVNSWCPAGGGHLGHREVIEALSGCGVAQQVQHRRVVLPALLAAGVERRLVERTSGWELRWGPARLEDLPAWLDRGGPSLPQERLVRFPRRDRLDMVLAWTASLALPAAVLAGALRGWPLGVALGLSLAVATLVVFLGAGDRTPNLLRPSGRDCGRPCSQRSRSTCSKHASLARNCAEQASLSACWPSQRFGVAACRRPVLSPALGSPRIPVAGSARWLTGLASGLAAAACVLQCPQDALCFDGCGGRLDPQQLRAARTDLLGRRVPLR